MSKKYHYRWREETTKSDSQYNIAAPLSQVIYMDNVMRFLSFLAFAQTRNYLVRNENDRFRLFISC